MPKTFYITWLKGASALTVGVGLIAAAAAHPASEGPWRLLYDLLDWPLDGRPATFASETRAVNAVLGGVMVGWGVLMYLLSSGPLIHDDSIRRMMWKAILAWFVIDSAGSFAAGFEGNILLNVLFMILLLPPLIGLGRFSSRQDDEI